MAHVYIGLSGYSYKPWQGSDRFYPPGLKQRDFLRFYATRYDTVELDGTWYRLPSEEAIAGWLATTPPSFLFAPKVHRQITHRWRLKPESYEWLELLAARFSPMLSSGHLGPLLIQLPPNFLRNDDRLGQFLEQLPQQLRWAVEFRHASWHDPSIETLLRRFNVGWVAADLDERPAERRHTADFWYVRLRRSAYTEADLSRWAETIGQAVQEGKDCYVYCKHEDEGAPWIWADSLLHWLEQSGTRQPARKG